MFGQRIVQVSEITYAHIEIVVAFFVVKLFSFSVITSYGVGVSSSKFSRQFLLGLLYLPIPTRAEFKKH